MVIAETPAETSQKGLFADLLEQSLSTDERFVEVRGFKGAWSSKATVEELTVADTDGIWLRLNDLVLDWNRTALLRRQIKINALTVSDIWVDRQPRRKPQSWSPEATEFQLPELPVSIQIDHLDIQTARLNKSVLGQHLTLQATGNASLTRGEGRLNFEVNRRDEIEGAFNIHLAYDNNQQELSVDLSLTEEANGIIASLLSIPNKPSVELNIKGSGPPDQFFATVDLKTNQIERITGMVRTQVHRQSTDPDVPPITEFVTNLEGNITSLLSDDYRPFFGQRATLSVIVQNNKENNIVLRELTLNTRTLNITGSGHFTADRWPISLDLSGQFSDPDDKPVLLPLPGTKTWIRTGSFKLHYDAQQSNIWMLDANISAFHNAAVSIETLSLNGSGVLANQTDKRPRSVSMGLRFTADGLDFSQETYRQAVGREISGRLSAYWKAGTSVSIDPFFISGENYDIAGSGTIEGPIEDLKTSGNVRFTFNDLSRLSTLLGRDIKGTGNGMLNGWFKPLEQSFDLDLAGRTTNLDVGQTQLNTILNGPSRYTIRAKRDTEALRIPDLEFKSSQASLNASALFSEDAGNIHLTLEIPEIEIIAEDLDGPFLGAFSARRVGEKWAMNADITGAGDMKLTGEGTIDQQGEGENIRLTGQFPLAILSQSFGSRSVSGLAELDLEVNGPLKIESLSGSLTIDSFRLYDPELQMAVTDVAGTIDITEETAIVASNGAFSTGGTFDLSGQITLADLYQATIRTKLNTVVYSNPRLGFIELSGTLDITGPLASNALISGQIELNRAEIQLQTQSETSTTSIPVLIHIFESPNSKATRTRAGLAKISHNDTQDKPPYQLDIAITSASEIFLRGAGLDTELGGELRLQGSIGTVVPVGRFELIRGWLDIPGKRLPLSEGTIWIEGNFTPHSELIASTNADDVVVDVRISGQPDNLSVVLSSRPELPEEEVLARLILGRSLDKISPLQAAHLADVASRIAGRGGQGIVARLRDNFGLDDLDLSSDEEGDVRVRTGKYLSEDLYTEIEVGSDDDTDINLRFDLSQSLSVKGRVGVKGDTGFGLFFERDY